MRQSEAVFVDSGAWIALALSKDPLHAQALEQWSQLRGAGAKLHTSVPVVIESFTFLERNANRDVAVAWKDAIYKPGTVKLLACGLLSASRSAQAVGGRCNQLCHHETRPHPARVHLRSSLCHGGIPAGGVIRSRVLAVMSFTVVFSISMKRNAAGGR
jgi:hypothetical protein